MSKSQNCIWSIARSNFGLQCLESIAMLISWFLFFKTIILDLLYFICN